MPPASSQPNKFSDCSLTLSAFPAHLLLHIIYLTFPQTLLPDLSKLAWQRKTLSVSLRLVNRTFYAACMHVLRSTHIPTYDALVRPPYTSDPFPLLVPHTPSTTSPSPYASIPPPPLPQSESPLSTIQREMAVLDRFIALKVREDVWVDDSELHVERDDAFKDLFNHAQPRARLEDLVRVYGLESGVICVGNPSENVQTQGSTSNVTLVSSQLQEPDTESKPRLFPPGSTYSTPAPPPPPVQSSTYSTLPVSTRRVSPKPSASSFLSLFSLKSKSKSQSPSSPSPSSSNHTNQTTPTPTPIPITKLSITLAPHSAGLILSPSRRMIVSTPRTRDEPLENVARRLVRALEGWDE